jgi:Tfp pilus assembly protein FimT
MRSYTLTEILLVIATLSIVTITIAVGHIAGWW